MLRANDHPTSAVTQRAEDKETERNSTHVLWGEGVTKIEKTMTKNMAKESL